MGKRGEELGAGNFATSVDLEGTALGFESDLQDKS